MARRRRVAGRGVAPAGDPRRQGHPPAWAARLGEAVIADIVGGDDDVLTKLDAIEHGAFDDAWAAMAGWMRATTLAGGGRAEEAAAVIDAIPPTPRPGAPAHDRGARLQARWALGEVDKVVTAVPPIIDRRGRRRSPVRARERGGGRFRGRLGRRRRGGTGARGSRPAQGRRYRLRPGRPSRWRRRPCS